MPVLICLMLTLSYVASLALFPERLCDFRAFYCAGRSVLAGRDPYREHPLHECERALPAQIASALPAQVTIPAPYPGYVLALFALLAALPFNLAAAVWTFGSCAALGGSIVRIAAVTRLKRRAVGIVLALPAATIALPLGQPTVFVLFGLAMCADSLEARQPMRAALAALVVFLDPQVGLAVAASLALAVPQTRLVLGAGIAALAVFDCIAFGPAREYEYLFAVLPAHALVNVPEFSQFSVSNLLFSAGIAPQTAVTAGNIWYALALVTGTIVGLRLRRRLGAAAVVFVPVAFAVFGGVHTHLQQLDLALPAFLLVLATRTVPLQRPVIILTFIAAVPWLICAALPPTYVAVAILGAVLARLMDCRRLSVPLGLSCLLILGGIAVAVIGSPGSHSAVVSLRAVPAGDANPLAQVAWGKYVRATSTPEQLWYVLAKVPTLLAFCAGLLLMCRVAFRPVGSAGLQRLATADAR